MRININPIREIRAGVIQFHGQEEVNLNNESLGLKILEPVKVAGTVTNTGEGFLVQAVLNLSYEVNCGRCLVKFSNTQKVEFTEQFIPGNSSDDLFFSFSGDYIDIKECLEEQIILALPMNFICSSSCLGLCPICGKNLNTEICGCQKEEFNPQFEKLKQLLTLERGGNNGKPQK